MSKFKMVARECKTEPALCFVAASYSVWMTVVMLSLNGVI